MFFLIHLIIVGILLLILEILLLPGLVAGIIGSAMVIVGVSITYNTYGNTVGHIVAGSSAALSALAVYFSFRYNVWKRFSLQHDNQSNITRVDALSIKPGDIGRSISAIRPMGTVMFGNEKVEVQTFGEMIDTNTDVEVVQVMPNKLIVKKADKEIQNLDPDVIGRIQN